MNIDWAALQKPFPVNDIEWRLQSCGKRGDKIWAICLAYVTNRAIMQRLDDVLTPAGWKNSFRTGPHGGVICGLSVKVGDEWITKWDGAENTQVEAVKGGLSDAMKRAGYQWGIGRYLYNLEEGFANVHDGGKFRGQTKDQVKFKWDPPALPKWALPTGTSSEKKKDPPKKETPPASTSSTTELSEAQIKLGSELSDYCNHDKEKMEEVLHDLSHYEKDGKTGALKLSDLTRKSDHAGFQKWIATTLGKLRKLAEQEPF